MNNKSIREKVIDFWNSFKEREGEIRELIDTRKLGENFNRVEELFEVDMPFMLGMSVDNKYELILNPSGLKSRYFIADYFKRKMPDELKEKAEAVASGSTFLEISGKMLAKLDTMMPNRKEQMKIASFFQSIDNLITLHRRELYFIILSMGYIT